MKPDLAGMTLPLIEVFWLCNYFISKKSMWPIFLTRICCVGKKQKGDRRRTESETILKSNMTVSTKCTRDVSNKLSP